MQEAG
jgi:hypothetical protein